MLWLATTQVEIDRGSWISPELAATGVSSYVRQWIINRRVKGQSLRPRTRETYEHSVTRWIEPTFAETPLARMSPAAVRAWNSDVSARGGPTAARQAYALLHAALRTAVDDGMLFRNPCVVVGAGQAVSPERRYLTDAEVRRLMDAMPKHLRALVTVAFFAQLRPGELLGLERRDVDLIAGSITISRQVVEVGTTQTTGPTKWSSNRVLALPKPAMDALRVHLSSSPLQLPSARVFVRPDGSILREHHLQYAWSKARTRAGLPHARLYDLRHAGLTAVAQEGATTREVMRRGGHSTARAAMIYQHAADSRDREIATQLGDRARKWSDDSLYEHQQSAQ